MGGFSKPATPIEAPKAAIQKTKAGRAPKPSAKLVANKNGKRAKDDSDDEDGNGHASGPSKTKKIKLSLGAQTPKTPTVIKAKFKGKPPKRPLGEGYDSEASDREQDPVIEEEWVLRMVPGPDCEYLRKAIQDRTIGLARPLGGADVVFKFLHPEGRRALLTIQGNHYAATLVDLPCVIEGMKSWDKKGWYKAADICQMLLVFKKISREAEALTVELPREIDKSTHQYPHGITPPMYFSRKRRFRKRISRNAIEAVEDAVEKLLEADAKALSTAFEFIEPETHSRQGSFSPGAYGEEGDEYSHDEDADADGEIDDTNNYFSAVHGSHNIPEEEDDLDLEAEMMAAFDEAEFDVPDVGTPFSQAIVETPAAIVTELDGPANNSADESSDGADDDDDEDAEGEEDDGVDEDERARLAQLQGAREDITELERTLQSLQSQAGATQNGILRNRIKANIEKVKAELQLKKSAIGEGDDDE